MSEKLKIDPYGFREYDARWLYEKDINISGITNLGKGLGSQIIKHTKKTIEQLQTWHHGRSGGRASRAPTSFLLVLKTQCNINSEVTATLWRTIVRSFANPCTTRDAKLAAAVCAMG